MRTIIIAITAALFFAATAHAQELRVGFITTLSGGGAILGKHQLRGLMLGLEHEGWKKDGDKLGGVPMKLTIGDDQRKPDVALRIARRMLQSDRVHVIAGIMFSNLMMAVYRPVTRAKRIMLSTNATPSPIAGRGCSPYFISSSWQNDQIPEAMGKLVADAKLKSVFLMAPNYQAGKDVLAGFERYYKGGRVIGRILFKLGLRDYQAEISRVRAARPQALFIFVPGGMGIAFMKQWAASGAGAKIKLYTVYTVDYLTLRPIGKAALGTFHTNYWDPTSKNPANQRFVRTYVAKYKYMPSHFVAQAYDGVRLLAAAVRRVGGKINDQDLIALARALRTVRYDSVRGPYKYNVNGTPIQDFYKREVRLGPNGKPMIVTTGTVFRNHKDSYWRKCPAAKRYPKKL